MVLSIDEVYRDHNTPGIPGSGDHEPDKAEIRALLKRIMDSGGQSITRNTYAALVAVTPPNENYLGIVLNDPIATRNGYYSRVGGAWTRGRGFPDTLASLTAVSGTNNLTATVSSAVDPATVVAFSMVATTTNSGAMTLSVAGETARPLLSAGGQPMAAAEIMTGHLYLIFRDGSNYRALTSGSFQTYFRGAWSNAANYQADDLVQSGGSVWIALQANTNVTPVAGVNWALFLPGATVADGTISRAKLTIGVSASVPRTLLEIDSSAGSGGDDTTALNTLLAATRYPLINPGTYKVDKPTIPSTLHSLEGQGDVFFQINSGFTTGVFRGAWDKDNAYVAGDIAHFLVTFETITAGLSPTGLMYRAKTSSTNIPPDPGPLGVDNTYWEYLPFANFFEFAFDDLTIRNIGFDVPLATYPHVRTTAFLGAERVRTDNLRFKQGGGIAIYAGNCVDILHTGAQIKTYGYMGGLMEGSLQENVAFANCHVDAGPSGLATAHGLSISLGKRGYIGNCISRRAGVFGMNVNETDQFRISGMSIDSKQEGFNTISGKNGQINGTAKWDTVLSIDFGVSIDGTTGSGVYNVDSNVVVDRSGVSALVMTGAVTQCTARVIARNCNQTGGANEAGILFSGTDCQGNTGYVTLIDQYSPHRVQYAIAEIDKGNGAPTANKLVVESSVGHLTQDALRAGPSSRIFGAAKRTHVPAVSDASGNVITAATVNAITWGYAADGIDIDLLWQVVPTALGSAGAPMVRATLPVAGVSVSGSGNGTQSTTSKTLGVENSNTHLQVKYYDGVLFPAAVGERMTVRARYTPSL